MQVRDLIERLQQFDPRSQVHVKAFGRAHHIPSGTVMDCEFDLEVRHDFNAGRRAGPIFWPEFVARHGQEQREWEPPRVIETKRGLGGGVNGRASNVDRLRLLGNGVYPATATKAFCELIRRHD